MIKSIGILGTALILGSSLFNASAFAGKDDPGERQDDSRDRRPHHRGASALVRTFNQSGINGVIHFSDSGNANDGISVSGYARGMDPNQTYVSLIYDEDSVARGDQACLPTGGNSLSFTQMVLGVWEVRANGVGTLHGTKTGDSYVALDDIGTTSIRKDTQAGTPLPSAPDPVRFFLQACGRVH